MDLGADGLQTLRYVLLPQIATALLAGGMLAFALSFDEIIVTLFTAGHERTLPIWFFNELFRKEWDAAVRAGTSLAVLMIDVDFFKKYNDTYGHIMGDSCLQSVAAALREGVKRPRDTIARYGGEEFVVILPETEREGAVHVAGLLIENVRARNIPHLAAPETGIVSVSVGVACARPGPEARPEELLNASDEALYRAKTAGRNRWSE